MQLIQGAVDKIPVTSPVEVTATCSVETHSEDQSNDIAIQL